LCGIVGLRLKNSDLHAQLGAFVASMLDVLASRGPDSTGVALYREDGSPGELKYSLSAPRPGYDWDGYAVRVAEQVGTAVELRQRARDAVVVAPGEPAVVVTALAAADAAVRLFGYGAAMEIYKDVGPANEVCARYGVSKMTGHQATGHTRMATESAVTIGHSHPFASAADLALVHNGSFSNYASVRRQLLDDGFTFDTDNDSEVAARFVAREMARGAALEDALRAVLKTFDGFFTLLVSSRDCLAVVRDSFACKPMVVAETDEYVAVASEYVALSELPGIEKADVFEPMPEEIYTWGA
jgi:glutamate synthase domain-containing protein 1